MTDLADSAEALIDAERDHGIARSRLAMLPSAAFDCQDCGEPIDPARKSAMPAARRCHPCQAHAEGIARLAAARRGGFLAGIVASLTARASGAAE